ncbi:MAG: DNA cytosine methyltransferase [Candidatus Berkelbacteria bacterium]|nr:DNA cytosine methyltransferase [Candidatus Berkelbacteria bacterium]
MTNLIKIVDLFAGPGGLGEGFSALKANGSQTFKIAVSVEKEASAHQTLTLRAFFRQFDRTDVPEDYYRYLRGEISKSALFDRWPAQAALAFEETLSAPRALGEDNELIDKAIARALGENSSPWVLIGGPPCQAYSLVGRARNKGVTGYKPEEDHRHFLYREYLRIIARFQPAIFVMENVKGMLSSRVSGVRIFDRVLDDLREPWKCLQQVHKGKRYRIYSLVKDGPADFFEPTDFIIQSEKYGIPQTRHRVILLGIREDIHLANSIPVLQESIPPTLKSLIDKLPPLRSGLSKAIDTPENWLNTLSEAARNISECVPVSESTQSLIRKLRTTEKSRTSPMCGRGAKFLPLRNGLDIWAGMPKEYTEWFADEKLQGIINHETRGHITGDLERYLYLIAKSQVGHHSTYSSPRLSEIPEALQPKHKNIKSGHFNDRFKVQLPHGPASTITSHISKDGHYYIHYDLKQCRSFTVREAARVQTFPDNYYFEGNRTQQFVQVGNAVPPLLANQIANTVLSVITDFLAN